MSTSTSQHDEHFDEKCPDLIDCQIVISRVLAVVTNSAIEVGSIHIYPIEISLAEYIRW